MQPMRPIKSRTPVGMRAPTYRINRPGRHSAIRRFAGYGIVR
jgi:hypothetical protein